MPQPEVAAPLVPGQPRAVDGLCPCCLLPSLVQVDLCAVTVAGVTVLGTWTGCAEENCDEGVEA